MDFHILVIEDNEEDIGLIRHAFTRSGPQVPVRFVNDGDQAIAYLSGAPPFTDRLEYPLPSLILLDLKLPRRSGLEVLAWTRSQSSFRKTPIIVFTSSSQARDVDRAYELGANSYLVKPNNFKDLLGMVDALRTFWMLNTSKTNGLPSK